jgi:hypothetical protein
VIGITYIWTFRSQKLPLPAESYFPVYIFCVDHCLKQKICSAIAIEQYYLESELEILDTKQAVAVMKQTQVMN